jgi:hypothetical protein
MDDLQALHKQLLEVLDKDQADFIVAYRQGGAYNGDDAGQPISGTTIDLKQKGNERLTTILDLIGVKTRIAKSTSSSSGSPSSNFGGGSSSQGSRSQSSSGNETASNGAQPSGNQGGNDANTSRIVIDPAFPEDKSAMAQYLPKLMDNLAVNAEPSIPGRLNINQAPRVLLRGIPDLTPDAVDQIIAYRDLTVSLQRPEQKYETWLLTDGIVDLNTMKKLMPLVTGGGSVYRAQVVGGFFVPGGPVQRVEVVVDGTRNPPVVRRRWDLRDLGRGYPAEVLGIETDDAR